MSKYSKHLLNQIPNLWKVLNAGTNTLFFLDMNADCKQLIEIGETRARKGDVDG